MRVFFGTLVVLLSLSISPVMACVSDYVRNSGGAQTIVVRNDCRHPIVWSLCARANGQTFREGPRVTDAGRTSNFGIRTGDQISYDVRSCSVRPGERSCNPGAPRC